MAERQWGGRRTPGSPAPVSGPGQLSQRTDGGPQQVLSEVSGLAYGENQGLEDLQSAAPMSASGQTTARATRRGGSGRAAQRAASSPMVPLMAPTQRPDEPVTAGAPFGPGAGPGAPMQPLGVRATYSLAETLEKMLPYDEKGDIARLYEIASSRGW